MIAVARDIEGIILAAKELLVHSLSDKKLEQMLKEVPLGDDAQLAKLCPRRELSPGYYDHVLYLMWLRQSIDGGVEFAALTADEADGLVALNRARNEFEKAFPPCLDCGQRNERGSGHLCPQRMRRNATPGRR